MCGITGYYNPDIDFKTEFDILKRMTNQLIHRGPDEDGYYCKENIALGQRRLSIIDLSGGKQPVYNEDKSVCVVFNGEIYNYLELRKTLYTQGHTFYTQTDTEVIIHQYEQSGKDFLQLLNGNFSLALWNNNKKELLIARDRVGIRPLFFTVKDNTFLFASEMKALFEYPGINPEIDIAGIEQVFTLWANVPPRTVFKNIAELAPGHFMTVSSQAIQTHKYWKHSFPDTNDYPEKPFSYYSENVKDILHSSCKLRLRADVPVAAYLSGGLDSSIIASLVKKHHNNELITFSVAFEDKEYDESHFQQDMAKYLGTNHKIIEANYESIGNSFSDVIRFAEKPTIRTAPAPLLILSSLVRQNGIKVVLTGEGADEVFGGYNIFKEDLIRRFWAKQPESKIRPILLNSIYPYINRRGKVFWQAFFKRGLSDITNPYYSHLIRWNNTAHIKNYFHPDIISQFNPQEHVFDALDSYIDSDILRWHPFCRAQYLEMVLFMSGYLLSTQGDRMMMGNSVEGRFPFLDHRVIEFASSIPPKYKCNILNEKYILKKTFNEYVPKSIINRPKQPYRAPIYTCFLNYENLGAHLIHEDKLKEYGYFNYKHVGQLLSKIKKSPNGVINVRDDMCIAGITSMQLLLHFFVIQKGL